MVQLKTDKEMEIGMKEKQALNLLKESILDKECKAAIMMTLREDGTGVDFKNALRKDLIVFLIHILMNKDLYPATDIAVALYLRNNPMDIPNIMQLMQDKEQLDSLLDKLTNDTQETA